MTGIGTGTKRTHEPIQGSHALPERAEMLMDILIAVIIVVIAAALGIIVHPLLWLILIVAVIWLFTRRASWSR
jgi:hypothetical protein